MAEINTALHQRFHSVWYPVNLAVSMIAPALITGNAVILKPPTQGAVSALHMVHCMHMAGFPKSLIAAITGKGSEIGDFLTMHPGYQLHQFYRR